MADAYIELAMKASFTEIINFWDTYRWLNGLFEAKGIDITIFKTARISFGRPTKMERGVYPPMVEINHSIEEYGAVVEPSMRDPARGSQSHASARNLWWSMVLTS